MTGLVQGVGYRFYAIGHARRLGLTGFVKNLPDGNVEAYAEGEKGLLEEFIRLLRVGPMGADVSGVSVEWAKPSGRYKSFSIEY
ncbi:MAG: acylphosphatase [candidate division Zixibacteria bacterium]|nr:acylphosphatase [candidate division Zixibacteria bacterium]